VAKETVNNSEMREREVQREVDDLNIELVKRKAIQVSILTQIDGFLKEKEQIRNQHNEINETMSGHVLQRKRIVILSLATREKGEGLIEQVKAARMNLEDTTSRAKLYEQSE
jgi:hypothetical protein